MLRGLLVVSIIGLATEGLAAEHFSARISNSNLYSAVERAGAGDRVVLVKQSEGGDISATALAIRHAKALGSVQDRGRVHIRVHNAFGSRAGVRNARRLP
jgi:hypothetical protein